MKKVDHEFLKRHVLIAIVVGLLIVVAGEYGPLTNASSPTAAVYTDERSDSSTFSGSSGKASIEYSASTALWKLPYAVQAGALRAGLFVDTSVQSAANLLWGGDPLTTPIKNHRAH